MKNNHTGGHIVHAGHKIKVQLDNLFEQQSISGMQARILCFVEKNNAEGKDVFQKDIENQFHIRPSSVTSVIGTMEKNGYIQRQQVEGDARLKRLVLTEKAKTATENHRRTLESFEERLNRNMSQQEIDTLKNLLDKVIANIEDTER